MIIPPEFIDIYTIFEKNEFDSEMTYTIMKKTIKELPVSLKSNQKKVNDFFKLILRRVIPIKIEATFKKRAEKNYDDGGSYGSWKNYNYFKTS